MTTTEEQIHDAPEGSVLTSRFSWLAFLLAALFLMIANGRHPVSVAPWAAMFLLLFFVRAQPKKIGLPLAWFVLFLAGAFQFRGMAPVPGIFYYLLWATYGFTMFLPFWIDRLIAPRLKGLVATLVFPCAWVTVEWLVTVFTPYGSWNALAYSQYENLVLLQLVAVTGLYGLSFLITWFAAAACSFLPGAAAPRSARGLAIFAAVLFVVVLGGGLRLTFFPPESSTVRVASLTKMDRDLFEGVEGGAAAVRRGQVTSKDVQRVRDNAAAGLDDLLARAELEVQAGAKILFWGETNNFAMKYDEPAIVARGAEFARRHGVYLGMASGVYDPGKEKPLENKIILFDPQGEVAFEYWKAIPVPGPSEATQQVDDGRIHVVDSPYGRLASAICYDMDFPNHLQQAGRHGADIILVPSSDWSEIDPWHTHMARFRAVEQGVNMVRHTSYGLSLAADYQGRTLAAMDHYNSENRALVAMVPTRGVRTIYSRVGDLFAWLCAAGLTASLAFGIIRSRRKRGVALRENNGED
jgi:apolipoprotein N-acyltransferase